MSDIKELVEAVRVNNLMRVEEDDPLFAFATITEVVLQQASKIIEGRIAAMLADFGTSMEALERRAGAQLAHEISAASGRIHTELRDDLDAAGLKAAHLVYRVDRAHKRPALIRWAAIGVVAGAALFGSG